MPYIIPDSEEKRTLLTNELFPVWQKLALSTGQADPICCAPAWNLAFHQIFRPDSRIFYLRDLESLLLLCEIKNSLGITYLMPLEDSWLFGQPLLGSYAPELLNEAIGVFLRAYPERFPPILLSGIQPDNPANIKLFTFFCRRFNYHPYSQTILCSASLKGGLDGWLGRRSANHRAKLRKAWRKAKMAGITFERARPENPESVASLYKRILNVARVSWKGIEKCGMYESPSREFYECLLEHYALTRMGYIIFAKHEERDIGFIFGGATGSIYRGQQFSYNQEYASYSIGNLLQLEKIKWLCEMGFLRYDMGPISGKRMGYKEHWTEQTHTIVSIFLNPK